MTLTEIYLNLPLDVYVDFRAVMAKYYNARSPEDHLEVAEWIRAFTKDNFNHLTDLQLGFLLNLADKEESVGGAG